MSDMLKIIEKIKKAGAAATPRDALSYLLKLTFAGFLSQDAYFISLAVTHVEALCDKVEELNDELKLARLQALARDKEKA